MRSGAALVAVGLASALLGACQRRPEPPLEAPEASPAIAQRVQVLNADVFVIDGKHVRLAGFAAPQPIPDARCWAEALAAKQATASVRDLFHAAHDLKVEPTGATDAYGRSVSRITLDGQDLGRTLHEQGLAAETAKERFGWCEPISEGEPGAPAFKALMDFSRG